MNGRSSGAPSRALAVDVGVMVATLAFAIVAVVVLPEGAPLRAFVGLVGLLLLPGYALTTLVFPARAADDARSSQAGLLRGGGGDDATVLRDDSSPAAVTDVERAALAFGLSVALTPAYGVIVASLGLGFGEAAMVATVAVVTAVLIVAGTARRLTVDPADRYALPLDRWARRAEATLDGDGLDVAIALALAAAVLVAGVSFAGAVVAPLDGSGDTSAALLTETDDGELVAAGYETRLVEGERSELVLEVTNREGETVEYTAIVLIQRLDEDGSVVESERLHRFDRTIAAGETVRIDHAVTATIAGDRIRFTYLLYRGEPPATPTVDSAYRHLSLSVEVEPT